MPFFTHRSSRRDMLSTLYIAGGMVSLAAPARLVAGGAATRSPTDDWAWLVGNWDVANRRLKERLAGSAEWEVFPGRSAMWLTIGGLGSIDDNIWHMPDGIYRGLGIRAFDPVRRQWAIWWISGRNPTVIDPPVRGNFDGDEGVFLGEDVHKGRPVKVRFGWHDIHGARPHWDQSFSVDDGATWEMNFTNAFSRTARIPAVLPLAPDAPHDFDFLAGRWDVRHRRLRKRLAGSTEWDVFAGTLVNWPVLGGYGNVGDNVMDFPAGAFRGVGFRTFDGETRQWSSWWLDGRDPANIGKPLRGGFANGTGRFFADDEHDGRRVVSRVIWSQITERSARWEQALSPDGGATWEVNWVSDFRRRG